jgi:hypothetical protein
MRGGRARRAELLSSRQVRKTMSAIGEAEGFRIRPFRKRRERIGDPAVRHLGKQ